MSIRPLACIALLAFSAPAKAADLALNDLPGILLKLRGCTEVRSFLSSSQQICRVAEKDLWVSVSSSGSLTIFKTRNYGGDTTYATGTTIKDLLRDFATKINAERDGQKEMLDALAPYLEGQ